MPRPLKKPDNKYCPIVVAIVVVNTVVVVVVVVLVCCQCGFSGMKFFNAN